MLLAALLPLQAAGATSSAPASVPLDSANQLHQPVSLKELPVPATVPASGTCTDPTGCISGAWGAIGSPGLFWDARHLLLGVTYAGAPSSGPASVYSGPQVLLVKTDGTKFATGTAWKCLTCGVAAANQQDIIAADFLYPPAHSLPGDK